MSLNFSLLVVIFATLTFHTTTSAQESVSGDFYVAPSLLYYNNLRARNSKDEKAYLAYDLKVGYQIYPDIFLGIVYQGEQDNRKTSGYSSATLNNSSKGVRTSLGPSIGYILPTYHIVLSYFLDSKWNLDTTTSSGTSKYAYTGSGFQLDLGYKISFLGFLFGPQLSYKSYSYGKLSTDGGAADSITPKLEESNLEPSIAFYFFF